MDLVGKVGETDVSVEFFTENGDFRHGVGLQI